MGKRGPKPQFTDVVCPNNSCKFHGLKDKGNVVGNGTSMSRGEKVRKYICRSCGKVFNDHTGTFYYDLRKEERVIDLALKMSMKGMSEEGIADVLGVKPATVRRWLDRAAECCDKVNETFMKDLNVHKIEVDEIWLIVRKNRPKNGKLSKCGPWMWVSFAPSCRLIVAFAIGPREAGITPSKWTLKESLRFRCFKTSTV